MAVRKKVMRDKAPKRATAPAPVVPPPRTSRDLQRQRLIDACISALYVHGPSNTTVERVTAIARMSPGIVRFYFTSKAAMLVASLQFLADEFEQQLLIPVSRLKADPVAGLQSLVDLYLDPQIAINLIGTPDRVAKRLEELIALGFNHFVIRNGTPGVPREIRHGMMKRFAAEVMPRFQGRLRTAA